jgi:hypothetical protein
MIPPLVAVLAKMNKRAPAAHLPFGRKPERNSIVRWIFSIRDV